MYSERITSILLLLLQILYLVHCDVPIPGLDGRVILDNNQILKNDVKPGQPLPSVVVVQEDGTEVPSQPNIPHIPPVSSIPANNSPNSSNDQPVIETANPPEKKWSNTSIVTTVAISVTAILFFVLAAFGFQRYRHQPDGLVASKSSVSSMQQVHDKEYDIDVVTNEAVAEKD